MKMVSIADVDPEKLVAKTAEELKKKIKQPDWAVFVKTGVSKERPPEQAGWWYVRAASVMRRVYIDGPVGISKLRSYYGGLHRRGHKPAHFAKGSGKILRVILQDLEKAGLVQKTEKRKGRILTNEGRKFMMAVTKQIK
jgi:small subunit ribosomal protein S19e